MRGTHLILDDAGEGWFPDVDGAIGGTIDEDLGPVLGHGRWYLVRLDRELELQESGHETVSGYRLVRYQRLLVSPRNAGEDLTPGSGVMALVCLLPGGEDAAEYLRANRRIDVWASCRLVDEP